MLGGGALLGGAGAVGLVRCDAMPETAIAAWREAGAAVADPRRYALAHAILAPNPHNMQPWLVDLRQPGRMTLHVDLERTLPATDPLGRQVLIGHGTFLELFDLAARERGSLPKVSLFPAGEMPVDRLDDRPVAAVDLADAAGLSRDPLFAAILGRRSNKQGYDLARPLEPADAAALGGLPLPAGFTLGLAREPALVAALRRLAFAAVEVEMRTPRTLRENVERSRVGAAEIARHGDGLALHGPLFWWLSTLGLFTREAAMTPGTMSWQGGMDYAGGWAAATPTFGWLASADNARRTQVMAGRLYARLNLLASERGVAMHPVSQLLQEYPEMAALQAEFLKLLGVPAGHTVQMLFRLGYAAPPEPSPRRPHAAIIRSA
jgi:hypothetical protein